MPDRTFTSTHPVMRGRRRARRGRIAWWRPAVLALGIVGVVVLVFTADVRAVLASIHDLVEGMGVWGPAVFLAIFVVWVVLALPGSWLSAMAGVVWGTVLGFGIAMAGATLGAALCFMIARFVARKPVAQLARRSERFCRLDRLTRNHGAIIVIVVRLVPLFPYNVTNYAFGLTAVGFWTYLFWSFLCMIPGTLFLVAGADALAQTVADREEGGLPMVLMAVALSSLALLGVLIVLARRELQRREASMAERGLRTECVAGEGASG
jgi:uncharacterized membrane protein YdjX (TVP38/TMEM64 family)